MKNRKGFTLVELLAVIVILGIIMMISIPAVNRWIDRGKAESDEGNKKTLVMAAQSYAQSNTSSLPKVIGASTIITAEELKNSNYLKEELVNSDKKNCMQSYVKVYKTNQKIYNYTAYIYCEGDTIAAEGAKTKPIITISFTGNKNSDEIIEDVSLSAFRVIIDGGNTSTTRYKLASYSYSISVRYKNSGKIVEIYNSGNIDANQQERIVIDKNLSEYTDITTGTDFLITVEAYNSIGGYRKQTADSSYKDNTPPTCAKIEGQAGVNSWLNARGSIRTITVYCEDGDGSGCVKDKYIKTFDTQLNTSTITIADNAGNTTECTVRVHIDWTEPNLTVTAYVRNANGSNGAQIGTITANHDNPTVTLNSFSNMSNGWLNKQNYPNGINLVASTSDNILLNTGRWSLNPVNVYSTSASNYETFSDGALTSLSTSSNTMTLQIPDNGLRYAKFVLTDKAGNTVRASVKAKLDHTDPDIRVSKSNLDTESGVNIQVNCTDGQSGCTSAVQNYSGVKSTTNYTVTDNAGNSRSQSMSVSGYNCHPYTYECGSYACGTYKCGRYSVCVLWRNFYDGNGLTCDGVEWYDKYCTKYCTSYCTGYKTCYR